ncbi:hypothetical protein [Conexivisphaera calida]|uniref:Uncharacterized protein n=1 Tax=Conexivisphaera calida TaxID=1874277 RepID=A0A4V0P1K8_9ARCH|nr:hypothetical protein [Conexivisphaera calida]BBE42070.1 hypothetical protein NAS2_0681 [Conexivisphaera calida]
MVRRRAVGDAIGALFMLVLLVASVAVLTYAIASMYVALDAAHATAVVRGEPARENLTLVFVAHAPPNGAPGAVVVNEGDPVNITALVQVVDGQFVVTPEDVYLPQGANAVFALQSDQFAVITDTGAAFSYDMTMPYVSIFAEGVSTAPAPGLYYWVGRLTIRASAPADWYVNGSGTPTADNGRQLVLYVDGPTTITALAR